MKLYEKIINGQRHCKPINKIVLIKEDMQIFNPTEEMLLKDGWIECRAEILEPSEEEVILFDKKHLLEEIIIYDSSVDVNTFYVNGFSMWLDKATRSGLMLRFQAESASGVVNTSLWYEGMEFTLSLENAINMLYSLELYASKCYDQTQYHLSEVNKLTSIEEIRNYDYKVGYPEKLQFNF